jgi:hypothetical protein
MCRLNEVPYRLIDRDPAEREDWVDATLAGIAELVAPSRSSPNPRRTP